MRNPIIRTIYLYLFALVGLGMLVVGSAMIINLGLKSLIFTKADQQDRFISRPIPLVLRDSDLQTALELKSCDKKCELTQKQKQGIDSWLADYEEWQDQEKNRDPNFYLIRSRQRQASTAISLILVGLP